MDRCRCAEYEAAVKKLRFFTVGTMMPVRLDKCTREGWKVLWVKNGISYDDTSFSKARVKPICPEHLLPDDTLPKEARKIEQMWCPFINYPAMKREIRGDKSISFDS